MSIDYYEIYPGGERTGEIIIQTERSEDDDDIVAMPQAEYDQASCIDRDRDNRGDINYHTGYQVTTFRPGDSQCTFAVAVLHPRSIRFDDPRVAAAARTITDAPCCQCGGSGIDQDNNDCECPECGGTGKARAGR